ncbi:holo-ACP synthase [Paenibacillus sp. An7]|uniref:holo-ACP synthase n=1 Tax=Paenibacillus sp. An7 TaxID=2689577 RepID=UPI001356B465|nr:holo-ACP synthase [Paenibacillus sp. An7]
MLVGIGMDLVDIERIEAIINRSEDSFLRLLLSPKELSIYDQLKSSKRKTEWLAGRFAAKEAASKAFGTGLTGIVTPDCLEILPDVQGRPELLFPDALARSFCAPLRSHLTITHTKYTAASIVILETVEPG